MKNKIVRVCKQVGLLIFCSVLHYRSRVVGL